MIGRRKVLPLAAILVSMVLAAGIPVNGWAMPSGPESIELEWVILQSQSYSCGAAALATWLTYFYNEAVSEREVLALAAALMRERDKAIEVNGMDALTMRDVLVRYGVESRGMQTDAAALVAYFERGGGPVMVQLEPEQAHYLVAIGVVAGEGGDERLVVADPAWGYRLMTLEALVRVEGFSGFVLVPLLTEAKGAEVRARQQAVLVTFDSTR